MPIERPDRHNRHIAAKDSEKTLRGLLDSMAHLNMTGQTVIEGPARNAHGGYCDMFFGYIKGPRTSRNARRNKVAIKRLRVHIFAEHDFAKMLAKEVSIWSRLDHPNVLVFVGYALEENGCPLLISEWMENGTIKEYVKSHADCNVHHLVIGIAEGLAYLHSKKVIHGDMKSANILVSNSGQPQICDFGISRIISASETLFGTSSNSRESGGTTRWMAPEFFAMEGSVTKHSDKTDIWAFGMTIYELLTGKVPYAHLALDPLVMYALGNKTIPSRPEEYGEWSLEYRRLWTVCEQCWNLTSAMRPCMSTIPSLLHIKEPRNLVPILVADPGGSVESVHISQGEVNRMITFSNHEAVLRAELLNFEEDIPATITLATRSTKGDIGLTVLTKRFSCPCIFDVRGIDKSEDIVNVIGGGPIDQNDSTSVKLANPDDSVKPTVMVKLKNLLDHMVTVQQPEANFEWDFNPGQEFVFNLTLNSNTIYCFTFKFREKMAKYYCRFPKKQHFIEMKKELELETDAEIQGSTIVVNMVLLFIVNFNAQITNVKSTCDINADLLPAQVYSCEVETGRPHDFHFTCNGITVSKRYHFDNEQGQKFYVINACESLSSGLPRRVSLEAEEWTTEMFFMNYGSQTITIKYLDGNFSADCLPGCRVFFQFIRGPCSFTFTQEGIIKHHSYTFKEVTENNIVYVDSLFTFDQFMGFPKWPEWPPPPGNTLFLKNPGNLLILVKCLELDFEATLLPQETLTHVLEEFESSKTYELILSCHGFVEKVKLNVHKLHQTIHAGPIYETISRTQSLPITSYHRFHGFHFVESLKRYIEYGKDYNLGKPDPLEFRPSFGFLGLVDEGPELFKLLMADSI